MTAMKERILALLGGYGDTSGDLYLRASIGTPGSKIEIDNEVVDTGQALTSPGMIDGIVEAVSDVLQTPILVGTAAPTAGTYDAGTFMLNTGGGGVAGWLCVATGSPGTWVALYAVYGTPTASAVPMWSGVNSRTEWTSLPEAVAATTAYGAMYMTVASPQGLTSGTPALISGTTAAARLRWFWMPRSNCLQYGGSTSGVFFAHVGGSLTFSAANTEVLFLLYKNGVAVPGGEIDTRVITGGDHQSLALPGYPVELAYGDYIEVWGQSDKNGTLTVDHLLVAVDKAA